MSILKFLKRKPQGKFIYTYTVGVKAKVLRADSMQDFVNKVINSHMASYVSREVNFICSNDPDAPQSECLMYQNSFYDSKMILTPIENE